MRMNLKPISDADQMVLLTLLVALSAYLASIRLVLKDRIQKIKEHGWESWEDYIRVDMELSHLGPKQSARHLPDLLAKKKAEVELTKSRVQARENDLRNLRWPDALIILSALVLGIKLLYAQCSDRMYWLSVALATVGGVVLLLFHLKRWSIDAPHSSALPSLPPFEARNTNDVTVPHTET